MVQPTFLTAAEAADILRVSPVVVTRLCRAGKIPATKPTGSWLIASDDLASFIEAGRNEAVAS